MSARPSDAGRQPSDAVRRGRRFVELPAGYSAQPAWGFSLGSGGLRCEFNRVYGPGDDRSVPVRRLDEGLCYWGVTLHAGSECRWLSFADALGVVDARLPFERFSSLSYMGPRLEGLLLGAGGGRDHASGVTPLNRR